MLMQPTFSYEQSLQYYIFFYSFADLSSPNPIIWYTDWKEFYSTSEIRSFSIIIA